MRKVRAVEQPREADGARVGGRTYWGAPQLTRVFDRI